MRKYIHIFCLLVSAIIFAENYSFAQTQNTESDNSWSNPAGFITVSPNPFDDEITVTIQDCQSKKFAVIRVFDLIGKEVALIDLKNKSGYIAYKLDFSRLRPGVYFCNLYSEHGLIETKKLFKTTAVNP